MGIAICWYIRMLNIWDGLDVEWLSLSLYRAYYSDTVSSKQIKIYSLPTRLNRTWKRTPSIRIQSSPSGEPGDNISRRLRVRVGDNSFVVVSVAWPFRVVFQVRQRRLLDSSCFNWIRSRFRSVIRFFLRNRAGRIGKGKFPEFFADIDSKPSRKV